MDFGYFVPETKEVAKTDFGTREVRSLLCPYLTMWFRSLWNWFVEGVWKDVKMPAGKALECCKLSLMGGAGQSSEDQLIKNVKSKGQTEEISAGNKDSTGCWTPRHVCYVPAENLSTLFSDPETLRETEIKGGRLINLIEKV